MNSNVVIRQKAFKTCIIQEDYESKDSDWQLFDKNTLMDLFAKSILNCPIKSFSRANTQSLLEYFLYLG